MKLRSGYVLTPNPTWCNILCVKGQRTTVPFPSEPATYVSPVSTAYHTIGHPWGSYEKHCGTNNSEEYATNQDCNDMSKLYVRAIRGVEQWTT